MKSLLRIIGMVAMATIFGCASYGGANLVPGTSTAAEVEATMGPPTEKLQLAGGEWVWFYSRQPYGRQTYAVRIGADHIVRSVEQRLTEENMKHLLVGKTTASEVRELLGPPNEVVRYPRHDGDSWEYNMKPGPISDWMILSVRFDSGNIVREVIYVDDPRKYETGADRGRRLL